MSQKLTTTRFHNIDLMKFFAMLFVIIYHSYFISYNILEDSSWINMLHYFFKTILSTCVPIFFFANGYLILNKPLNLKKHVIKTIALIFTTEVWAVITMLVLMPVKGEYLSLKELIYGLWTWKGGWINHLWFACALVCIYFFFPLLKVVFDHNRLVFAYFTGIAAVFTFGNRLLNMGGTFLANVFLHHAGSYDLNLFNNYNPLRGITGYAFVYFCLGGLTYAYRQEIADFFAKKKIKVTLLSSIALLVSCILLFIWSVFETNIRGYIWDNVWCGYDMIFTLGNVFALYFLCQGYAPKAGAGKPVLLLNRFINEVSTNSLGIYFLHQIFIHMSRDYFIDNPTFNSIFWQLLYTIIIAAICVVVTKLLKKIPFLHRILFC